MASTALPCPPQIADCVRVIFGDDAFARLGDDHRRTESLGNGGDAGSGLSRRRAATGDDRHALRLGDLLDGARDLLGGRSRPFGDDRIGKSDLRLGLEHVARNLDVDGTRA
jgi:hypothetical protein